jgi:hypothetical protein
MQAAAEHENFKQVEGQDEGESIPFSIICDSEEKLVETLVLTPALPSRRGESAGQKLRVPTPGQFQSHVFGFDTSPVNTSP